MAGGQGSSGEHGLGRSCFMPGFSSTSSDNRDTYQRNFFGGNKDDFSERTPSSRPFGAHRDPVPPFCADRDPPFRSTTNIMRFGQNFSAQAHEFNNRSDRASDAGTNTGDRSAPFGRRMNNSPRFPQPGQFEVTNNRQSLTDPYFSGLPVDPWMPSGTGATAGAEWRPGGTANQDFQSSASGTQMYSASMALQRISTNQSRKRPWQQLLSAVGRRNSRDQDLPADPDLVVPGDTRTVDGQGPATLFPKGRPGRKQSKPLKHEGADQNQEDDLTLTPDSFTTQAKDDTSTNEKAESDVENAKFNAKPEQDVEQVETPEPFALSVKSDSITEEKIDPEPEEPTVETYGDYNDNPLTFDELRTLFPLTLMYGESAKDERVWPQDTVVLSTVEVQCGDARVRYCHIARTDSENHAEVLTMNKLREISLDDTSTLKITLVMNYTPCFYCACRILSYFFDLKSRKVNVAMELKFSNLYRVHMYPCDAPSDLQTEIDRNIDGLQTLHLNGVGLQTFSGVESWYENLLNSVFLDGECKERVQEIIDIVESEERKEREERDEEDLCNILGL